MQESLIDELLLKLEPVWGKKKIESLKLVYQLGDKERKERLEKILSIAVKKHLNDSLLNNQVMLPPSTKKECSGKKEIFLGTVCYGKNNDGSHKENYPLYLEFLRLCFSHQNKYTVFCLSLNAYAANHLMLIFKAPPSSANLLFSVLYNFMILA